MLKDRLKPYIEKIARREMTGREVAAILGTNETYVCRVLKSMQVEREAIIKPPSNKELNAARAEHRARLATTLSPAAAARAAGCSLRTIYRIRKQNGNPA